MLRENMSNEVSCPDCGATFDITEQLRAHIEREVRGSLSKSIRKDIEGEFESRMKEKLKEEEKDLKYVRELLESKTSELSDLKDVKREYETYKLEQTDLLKDEVAKAEREVRKRFNQELDEKISERIKEETGDLDLKIRKLELERERQNVKIKELEEQATVGHGELEGEVLELAAEDTLRDLFPLDSIKEVKKGAYGADIEHMVLSPAAAMSGKILWECKKHKNWDDDWVNKVRQDAADFSADVPVIVSTVMPDGTDTFGQIEEVWVCKYHELPLVATLLRHALLVASRERKRDQNMMTIQERVVEYISGPKFSMVMRSVMEAFSTIENNIRVEENYMKTNRKKNRLKLQSAIDSITSMAAELHHLGGGEFEVMRQIGFEPPQLLTSGSDEGNNDNQEMID
jgi:hypothetical protein